MYWIIPAAALSAYVAYRISLVIREWLRRRRSGMSDWAKVRRGETKRGYRLWLEPRCCPDSQVECHYPMGTPFMNNNDGRTEEETTSVFMVVVHRNPYGAGRYKAVLRRYSIYSSNAYTDIVEVVYRYEQAAYQPMAFGQEPYDTQIFTQLDERTVAMVFKRRWSNRLCVILIDVKENSSRCLEITPPPEIKAALFTCRYEKRPNHLRIVYSVEEWDQQGIITIDYEIDSSGADPTRLIAREVANQSITIPGHRKFSRLHVPDTIHLKTTDPGVQSFVFTFDHRGNYRGDSYDNWKRSFEASLSGQQWIEADIDFESLSPEIQAQGGVRYLLIRHDLLHVSFMDVYSPRPAWSIVQRCLKVPSMKSSAAEAICRALPIAADFSKIKAETGVDIFDGIFENQKKPTPEFWF